MSPQEFRAAGHEVVDWIAEYLEHAGDYPVVPECRPGALIERLPTAAPGRGEPIATILADFRELIVPATTHWNHPRFFAYFANSASPPGILGEMLTAALNVNGMVWKSSPAATELEQVTLDWLRQWLGLPVGFFGMIHDTASTATMHAIAAARELADPSVRDEGGSRDLILYCSEHAHSSVDKGAMAIGVGLRNVRKIAVDREFGMRPDALREAIHADIASGRKPFCVVASVGTTSLASIDPVPEIAAIAREHGLWLHVDAAYGGGAAIVPEFRDLLAGAGEADSLVMNPHKWLFTPMDLSAFYTRRPEILRRAYSVEREYLRTTDGASAVNYMDYGVPLGRRFRALKLWFVMRSYGHEGAAAIIRRHIGWAKELAAVIAADARFELIAPVRMSLVCFRYRGSDDENKRLLDAVNASGRAFLSHTAIDGRIVLRLAIGNMKTTREDVMATWDLLRSATAPDSAR